jgi:hypothetical protein
MHWVSRLFLVFSKSIILGGRKPTVSLRDQQTFGKGQIVNIWDNAGHTMCDTIIQLDLIVWKQPGTIQKQMSIAVLH